MMLKDSALQHDPDFISIHRIKPTHNQNHPEYRLPQNSEVRVASKIQAKNKKSPLSL